ncbi:histidine kinase [Flavihumibacter rivuli]|uniref:sensor histidine kinase n=1 Tax=Flavihumibacter rivuli TaxID=2838156 RepID=UPI001BDEA788|nr:sensor histidine kinase [Flavihumibacter rivuli]ULQ57098.1 histidine kinase [Flavihumibacter rivuli]
MNINWTTIKENRYFIAFIVLFAYAQTIHSRILVRQELNAYTFTPDGAISTLITVTILFLALQLFTHKWQRSALFNLREMMKIFGASLFTSLVLINLISLSISILFGNVERNFNSATLLQTNFANLLDGFIYGSFYLAFYYYKKNRKQQEELANYNQALSESRISQLKSQLNPHFLFNNLNVLDQLIYEDRTKASGFLHEFADIYRYVLQSTNRSTVPLREELAFAQQYFQLISYKYGNAYQLHIDCQDDKGFIVPLTLQLLIENSVKHNMGTEDRPVAIVIHIGEQITVSNNRIPKQRAAGGSGKALINLEEQYTMLTKRKVEVNASTNQFSVTIPIIQEQ